MKRKVLPNSQTKVHLQPTTTTKKLYTTAKYIGNRFEMQWCYSNFQTVNVEKALLTATYSSRENPKYNSFSPVGYSSVDTRQKVV